MLSDYLSLLFSGVCFVNMLVIANRFYWPGKDGMLRGLRMMKYAFASGFGYQVMAQSARMFLDMPILDEQWLRANVFRGCMLVGTLFGLWALRVRKG